MSTLNLQGHTAGTEIKASDFNTNYDTLETVINGGLDDTNYSASSGMYTAYRTIHESGPVVSIDGTAADYFFGNTAIVVESSSTVNVPRLLRLEAADYAITGRTTKLRVRATLTTNGTPPAITYTVGLYPVTSIAGGSDVMSVVLGVIDSGSQVNFNSPSANGMHEGDWSDFTIPADGYYVLGASLSGAQANNSIVGLRAQLQQHWT